MAGMTEVSALLARTDAWCCTCCLSALTAAAASRARITRRRRARATALTTRSAAKRASSAPAKPARSRPVTRFHPSPGGHSGHPHPMRGPRPASTEMTANHSPGSTPGCFFRKRRNGAVDLVFGILPGEAVDRFADEVGVADVAGVFLDHVHE